MLVGGLALAALMTAGAGRAAAGKILFQIDDPKQDDLGDGTLRYPLNYYGLAPGDLDLVSLSARRVGGGTEFQATFGAPVRSPSTQVIDLGGGQMKDLARFGFYGINLDIYVDVDRVAGSGGVKTLPGRKSVIRPDFAWEKAIVLTPRPYEAKSELKRALLRELKRELAGKQGVGEHQADAAQGDAAERDGATGLLSDPHPDLGAEGFVLHPRRLPRRTGEAGLGLRRLHHRSRRRSALHRARRPELRRPGRRSVRAPSEAGRGG